MDIDVLAITGTRRHPEAFVYASCDVGYFGRFDKIGGIGFLIKGDLAKTEIDFILADKKTEKDCRNLEVIGSDHRLLLLTLSKSIGSPNHQLARHLYFISRLPNPTDLWELALKNDWSSKIKQIEDIENDFERSRSGLQTVLKEARKRQAPNAMKRLGNFTESMLESRKNKCKSGKLLSSSEKVELVQINKVIKFFVKEDLDVHKKKVEAIILRKSRKTVIKANWTQSLHSNIWAKKLRSNAGVKQGDCLSPRLFTLLVQYVIYKAEIEEFGFKKDDVKLDYLGYAGDMVLLANDSKKLQKMLNRNSRSLKTFLENIIRDAVTYCEHAKKKTVTAMDVVYALKRQGKTLYGFGG
uniref:Histone H4 n=1 Tax=Rhabditophanes sp. KR3021 TaxID=114890 RepID=A0AC35UCJ2_9BILA